MQTHIRLFARRLSSLKHHPVETSSIEQNNLFEEIPQNSSKKEELDFRNKNPFCIVYGAGLTKTGSLATKSFITVPTSPEVLHRPMVIRTMKNRKIRKVSAGCGFSLFASKTDLFGSGLNNFYQLGGPIRGKEGVQASREWYINGRQIPLPQDSGKIVDVSAGRLHSVVGTEKCIYCFGSNTHGQCGVDPSEAKVVAHNRSNGLRQIKIPDDSPIRQIHCCLDTSFVLLDNGKVFAWGLGTDGQLGNGEKNFQFKPQQVKGDIEDIVISRIGGNTDTIVAFSKEGELFAWGQNEYGQLGVYSDEPQVFFPQHLHFNLGKVISASATGSSCIVCNSEGHVFTWGSQVLGFGPKILKLDRPMQIDPPIFQSARMDEGFVQYVYAGSTAMAAVTSTGQLFTWGANRHGLLATGNLNHQFFPLQVFIPYSIRNVSLGPDHSLFVTK